MDEDDKQSRIGADWYRDLYSCRLDSNHDFIHFPERNVWITGKGTSELPKNVCTQGTGALFSARRTQGFDLVLGCLKNGYIYIKQKAYISAQRGTTWTQLVLDNEVYHQWKKQLSLNGHTSGFCPQNPKLTNITAKTASWKWDVTLVPSGDC